MSNLIINTLDRSTNYVVGKISKIIPKHTFANEKVNKTISWVGQELAAPHTNRLIMGASALMSQPFIDLSNKKVDEDTRRISAMRTISKIIVGTTTGYIIRGLCLKAIDYCTQLPEQVLDKKNIKLKTLLTPSNATNSKNFIKQYRSAISTLAALFVMTFTNFLIDAPCTMKLTNKLIDKLNEKNKPKENGGSKC